MDNTRDQRLALQDAMVFLGAVASGTEQAIGASANSISYLAGVHLGRKLSSGVPRTGDIAEALAATREVLEKNDYMWLFEPFQTHDREALFLEGEEGTEVMLVFRDCMIRQSLFRFGHSQKGSLCNMMYGFFAGLCRTSWGGNRRWRSSMPARTPATRDSWSRTPGVRRLYGRGYRQYRVA